MSQEQLEKLMGTEEEPDHESRADTYSSGSVCGEKETGLCISEQGKDEHYIRTGEGNTGNTGNPDER